MAYTYHVSFDISPKDKSELEIGSNLERVCGYLKTLLPAEDGFVEVRAMSSLDNQQSIHVVLESTWLTWEDLLRHRNSTLTEDKVLTEFEPYITYKHLSTRVYRDIS